MHEQLPTRVKAVALATVFLVLAMCAQRVTRVQAQAPGTQGLAGVTESGARHVGEVLVRRTDAVATVKIEGMDH